MSKKFTLMTPVFISIFNVFAFIIVLKRELVHIHVLWRLLECIGYFKSSLDESRNIDITWLRDISHNFSFTTKYVQCADVSPHSLRAMSLKLTKFRHSKSQGAKSGDTSALSQQTDEHDDIMWSSSSGNPTGHVPHSVVSRRSKCTSEEVMWMEERRERGPCVSSGTFPTKMNARGWRSLTHIAWIIWRWSLIFEGGHQRTMATYVTETYCVPEMTFFVVRPT